ncbi:MAG: 50S ribosomal protein L22 [candidate division Zixibacteria bacterium]|nr:50S ribosomal protein L22 [candidate division Zixibacteria bacterium]
MEAVARARYLRGSARKMRQVAGLVKGMPVRTAEQYLRHMPKAAAAPLAKVIKSATANALAVGGTGHHKADELVVADVRVDGGPIARRFRAVGMGRAYRIRKRYCHVHVTVSDGAPVAKTKKGAVKGDPTAQPEPSPEESAEE